MMSFSLISFDHWPLKHFLHVGRSFPKYCLSTALAARYPLSGLMFMHLRTNSFGCPLIYLSKKYKQSPFKSSNQNQLQLWSDLCDFTIGAHCWIVGFDMLVFFRSILKCNVHTFKYKIHLFDQIESKQQK